MLILCPSCNTEYDCEPGKYECECGAKFTVSANGSLSPCAPAQQDSTVSQQTVTLDIDKTIPPRQRNEASSDIDATMPGRRDRKPDGRFAVSDLILDRYKVLSELGQGGMGVVYECFDEIAGIKVALKALPPELSHNTQEMEDIKENFQLVSRLVHQNIAISKNLEKDNTTGNYYLIMECVEGEDLRCWIRRKRKEGLLTVETILPVIRQVAAALDYAHEEKIIHRDIKPGNIMIDAAGHVKVLDFGLAAQIHTSMTRVSMAYHGTSGTAPYMAPEQWRGRAQGAAADQYALAVMTYEMLAGHLPFESTDASVLQQAVLTQEPEIIKDQPRHVQQTLTRGLSKDPEARFNSCIEFANELDNTKHSFCMFNSTKRTKTSKKHKGKNVVLIALLSFFVILFLVVFSSWLHESAKKDIGKGVEDTSLNRCVFDNANVFTSNEQEKLNSAIKHLEMETNGKMIVYTVSTVAPLSVEEYSLNLATKYLEQQFDTTNCALLLLAINDRRSRIEIGAGWENKISDVQAKDLLEMIVPELRDKRYADAAITVVQEIESLLTGRHASD